MTIRTTPATSLVMTLVVVAAATLLAAAPAFAHARYKSSTPGTAEVLTTSPPRVEITFTQQIRKVGGTYGIEVARDRGAAVTSGPALVNDADRTKLSLPLQAALGPGRYVVNWKQTSDEDGESAVGAFAFYVNKQPNAVDLENDAQLERIGGEPATPGATASAAAAPVSTAVAATAGPTRPAASASAGTSAATPIPTTSASRPGGSGGGDAAIYVVAALVAAGAIAGFGVWRYLSRRGR